MTERSLILTLSCDAKPGIIAAVTAELAARGANIAETAQFWDRDSNRFFLRLAFLVHAFPTRVLYRARTRTQKRPSQRAQLHQG